MLTINATNFGIAPSDIHIKEFHTANMLVLDGEFTVDTTAPEYAGIRPMQLTVADLPFAKSRASTAIVTVLSEGVKYATVTKVWISDMNTINIAKITPYKSIGSYVVKFSTLLIPEKITGAVTLNQRMEQVPYINKGSADDIVVHTVETADWLMLILKVSALTFDEESQTVEMYIPTLPEDISCSFPVFYNEGLWVALGSKYYPATLNNGNLIIRKDGNADEADGTGYKFTRIIVVR